MNVMNTLINNISFTQLNEGDEEDGDASPNLLLPFSEKLAQTLFRVSFLLFFLY